jgi:dihydrodipicolinate synthase/N-acetylneuraminate lyase
MLLPARHHSNYKYDDDAVYSFFRSLIKKVNIPVFVYNIPPRVGYSITPSLLKRIVNEGACGIKDTVEISYSSISS